MASFVGAAKQVQAVDARLPKPTRRWANAARRIKPLSLRAPFTFPVRAYPLIAPCFIPDTCAQYHEKVPRKALLLFLGL